MQNTHSTLPLLREKVPAAQISAWLDPCVDTNLPGGATSHAALEVAPVIGWNFPAGHARQATRLLSNVPVPHSVHEVATSRDIDPAEHVLHDGAPTSEKVPAEHCAHTLLPSFELKVPAVQFLATLLLAIGAKVPAGANKQSLKDSAPSKGWYVLAGQLVQVIPES